MSTSGDRTSRIKYKISEQSEPAPCCTPSPTYVLLTAAPQTDVSEVIQLFALQEYIPAATFQDIIFTATANLLYSGINTTTATISYEYSIDGVLQAPAAGPTITLQSGIPATITMIDILPSVANALYTFNVWINSPATISITAGTLLLAGGTA